MGPKRRGSLPVFAPERMHQPIGAKPNASKKKYNSVIFKGFDGERKVEIQKAYGLALCPGGVRANAVVRKWDPRFGGPRYCGEPIMFTRGQKVARCRRCGKRHWLAGLKVIYQTSDLALMKRIINGIHSFRSRGKFIPLHRFGIWEARYHAHRLAGQSPAARDNRGGHQSARTSREPAGWHGGDGDAGGFVIGPHARREAKS